MLLWDFPSNCGFLFIVFSLSWAKLRARLFDKLCRSTDNRTGMDCRLYWHLSSGTLNAVFSVRVVTFIKLGFPVAGWQIQPFRNRPGIILSGKWFWSLDCIQIHTDINLTWKWLKLKLQWGFKCLYFFLFFRKDNALNFFYTLVLTPTSYFPTPLFFCLLVHNQTNQYIPVFPLRSFLFSAPRSSS